MKAISQFIEMFGDPRTNPLHWPVRQIKDCLVGIDNGKSLNCESFARPGYEPAVLKLSAVTYGEYNPKENKMLPSPELFIDAAEVHNGDLLFSRKNTREYVGMTAYVKETPPNLMMPDLIFRLVTRPECRPRYLGALLNHPAFRPIVTALANGTTGSMPNISKQKLSNLTIVLPPVELQNKFEAFLEQADKSKFAIQQSLP